MPPSKERLAALARLDHLSSTARALVDGFCNLISGSNRDEEEDRFDKTSLDEAARGTLVASLLDFAARSVYGAKWPYNARQSEQDRKKALAGFLDALAFVHGADIKPPEAGT
jgi:hypothetical protein